VLVLCGPRCCGLVFLGLMCGSLLRSGVAIVFFSALGWGWYWGVGSVLGLDLMGISFSVVAFLVGIVALARC